MLNDIKQDAQQRMTASVDALRRELRRLHTGDTVWRGAYPDD